MHFTTYFKWHPSISANCCKKQGKHCWCPQQHRVSGRFLHCPKVPTAAVKPRTAASNPDAALHRSLSSSSPAGWLLTWTDVLHLQNCTHTKLETLKKLAVLPGGGNSSPCPAPTSFRKSCSLWQSLFPVRSGGAKLGSHSVHQQLSPLLWAVWLI